MSLSILDVEFNRGVDAAIEDTRRMIDSLKAMGCEFEKGEFDWVHSQCERLEELAKRLERLKRQSTPTRASEIVCAGQ